MKRWFKRKSTSEAFGESLAELADLFVDLEWFTTPEEAWEVMRAAIMEQIHGRPNGFTSMADVIEWVAAKIGEPLDPDAVAAIADWRAKNPAPVPNVHETTA